MFGMMIWDKLPECIFKSSEISEECDFKIFKYHEGDLSEKLLEPNMWLLVNHTKPMNTLYWN